MKKLSLAILFTLSALISLAQSSTKPVKKPSTKTVNQTTAKATGQSPASLVTPSTPSTLPPGKVDKASKEFYIPAESKGPFRFYGYEFPNISTRKMICFSTNTGDVAANIANCPLGSYYNTNSLRQGDRIVWLGKAGSFARMNYITGDGKKTIFYLQNSSFAMK